MEDGKIRPQSHSVEYDWLGPDLMRNTRARYILILPVVLITSTPYSPATEVLPGLEFGSHYLPFARRLLHYVYIMPFRVIHPPND